MRVYGPHAIWRDMQMPDAMRVIWWPNQGGSQILRCRILAKASAYLGRYGWFTCKPAPPDD